MSGLSTIAATLLGSLTLTLAPIPPEPKPDPYGRGYLGVWFEGSTLSIDRVEPNMPARRPDCGRTISSSGSTPFRRNRPIR